jgi:hypothetical protein
MIHLVPCYKQKLKSSKPVTITVSDWSPQFVEQLQACFDCTDWSALYSPDDDLDESVAVISSYIDFCVELNIPQKITKSYPNNKPWVTPELKLLLNKKKRALASKDKNELKSVQAQLRTAIKACKSAYKDKIESFFRSSKSSDAWKGLQYISGYKAKSVMLEAENPAKFSDELNKFYARFNTNDDLHELNTLLTQLRSQDDDILRVSEHMVRCCLQQQNTKKAVGPDHIPGRVLKECSDQLAPVFTSIFNASLLKGCVPNMWKTSTLIPVPKPGIPKIMNDLRPVAVTALVMKCLRD